MALFADEQEEADTDRPIFVLASGFRSGSTLLPRLVTSGGPLIWGEPLMQTGWLFALIGALIHLPGREFAHLQLDRVEAQGALQDQWIANLNPGIERFKAGQRAMLRTYLAPPSRLEGRSGWGAKFVRLDGYHAQYLRWLFPRCRIVMLERNPVDSFLSYKTIHPEFGRISGRPGWTLMPGWPLDGAERFFAAVHHQMDTFRDVICAAPEDAILIRFEDLLENNETLARLCGFLGLELDPAVLARKLTGMEGAPNAPAVCSEAERAVIERWAPRFLPLGYRLP